MKDPERKIMRFKVDVTPLQQSDRFESFNHASHQCYYFPHLKIDMMDCLTYTHLDHVHLRCSEDLNGGFLCTFVYWYCCYLNAFKAFVGLFFFSLLIFLVYSFYYCRCATCARLISTMSHCSFFPFILL
ncbi:hypothetical protein BC829DRAFT_272099 [Chytridium lagenaria]|nr:hypothetical protein BC829DRAFT_272099 [Chytridium lagenaria]